MSRNSKYISGTSVVEIIESVRGAVGRDELKAGAPLPSIRELAGDLRVHRNTVANAYARLASMGVIETQRGRAGSRVARRDLFQPLQPSDPDYGGEVRNLAFGNPDGALLPDLKAHFAQALERAPHLYGAAADVPELVAFERARAKAAGLRTDQVIVTSGAADAIERVLLAHLAPGDSVAVEEPCYTRIVLLIRALGLRPLAVTLDEEGMQPSALAASLERGARAVILTPLAQNPTGATLSLERAAALSQLLSRHPDVLLIEDDHFGALARATPRSLLGRSLAPVPRWAIARSMSKFLGPDLRVAFLHTDATTAARVKARLALGANWVSHILQVAVHVALQDPTTTKSIAKAGETYAKRREALLAALHANGVPAMGREGLHVWLPTPHDARLAHFLLARGWAVQTGENFRIERSLGLRITTSTLAPKAATVLAKDIADAFSPRERATMG